MNAVYCGPPPPPDALWQSWNLDPPVVLALLAAAVILRRDRAGLAGVAVLAAAFVSPLCALSSALFSARVVHHVLLVAVAAPLLAHALPRRRAGAVAPAFAASTAALWFWHAPAPYDFALSNVAAYWLMQLTLLGGALWFWRAVFGDGCPAAERVGFVVAGYAQMGMLGALLTFAPLPLYGAHALAPFDWGLAPLDDQRLGGLLMWVPAGAPYAVALALVARRSWSGLRSGPAW